jgi:23S rRNA (guanine2445-N2)-methyltransferase / 23S rRNA (guanine2069-N7)-methyltransferase
MSDVEQNLTFFASCAKSLESLLEEELRACGAQDIRQTVAGVYFTGTLLTAYRALMYLRVANRVVLILQERLVTDADSLYDAANSIDWLLHMDSQSSFAITASGSTDHLRHTQFIAQRIKDAIVDQFRERGLPRPDVSKESPDLRIHAVIKKNRLMLGLELMTDSLHRRSYRLEQGEAPMKETLAAALLMRAGWPELMKQNEAVLYDPMCGAGTLLIEGVLMALDIAPGLLRQSSLSRWPHHRADIWQLVKAEAEQRRDAAKDWNGQALGSDQDLRTLGMARRNAERAGVWDYIEFSSHLVEEAKPARQPTLLITNPPYAERLGEDAEVMRLYQQLGTLIREHAKGCEAAVFTARPEWGKLLGMHSHKQYALFNGALPAKLLLFHVNEETIYQRPLVNLDPRAMAEAALDEGGLMLANRLRKNLKNLGRWAKQQGISCYRLYDADMPEYSFAIDVYTDEQQTVRVHMQEYKAPASVSEEAAALRRRQAVLAVQYVMELSQDKVIIKVRERQKGKQQYQPSEHDGQDLVIREGDARLIVNLEKYLDTGLFLDHRPMRRFINQQASGKEVLNLFCYTGSVTVQAALGGASRTVSVDLSRTYLNWARRNLELNGLDLQRNELVELDCITYLQRLATSRRRFDLIFLDPPTFSNSKSTDNVLDVQRDHVMLVDLCMQSLKPGGLLIFSNNMRRFKLDEELTERYQVEDFSARSLDKDFERNQRIHQTWLIRMR